MRGYGIGVKYTPEVHQSLSHISHIFGLDSIRSEIPFQPTNNQKELTNAEKMDVDALQNEVSEVISGTPDVNEMRTIENKTDDEWTKEAEQMVRSIIQCLVINT